MKGHAANTNNLYYYNRHALECKKCDRMLFTGNVFQYNWSGTNQGAMVAMTITPGAGNPPNLSITSATNGVLTMATALTPQFLMSYPDMTVRITGTSSAHDGLWKIASASGSTITLVSPPTASSTGGTLTSIGIPNIIGNLDFRHNTFASFPILFLVNGYYVPSPFGWAVGMSNKMRIENNLILDMNSSSNAAGGWTAASPAPVGSNGELNYLITNSRGYGNIQFVRNTVDGITTSGAHTNNLLFTDPSQFASGKGNRLDFTNNLINGAANTRTMNDSSEGSAGLNARYTNWFFDGNVIAAGNTSSNKPAGSPANAYPESESGIGWQKASAKNFRVKYDSAYFQAGKGADIAALEAAQGKVSNPRVMRITSTTAKIGYYAPDSAACTIEYSTSATSGTGMRVSDGGRDRVRNVSLSGLSPDTPYYIRVLCAAEQPSLELRTAP